jgi:hypothetical protein
LLLLQARKYLIVTGTVTIARAMMRRWKKEGTSFHPVINWYRNQREMNKTDTQIQTPRK